MFSVSDVKCFILENSEKYIEIPLKDQIEN